MKTIDAPNWAAGDALLLEQQQVRDCTRARGCLAKADRVDAILTLFARCIRPEARPLKDEETRAMEALLNRRRQLVNTKAQEMLRRGPSIATRSSRLSRNV
ncbi:MAG: hypothetical protein LBO00_03820 [Zoogloeaceae bacterium]|nr:hypothetical protein [Zoogloeaceae bacterium]